MLMDSGLQCQGEIFKQVLAVPVNGSPVQMWVKFKDDTFQSRFIGDQSITSFEFIRTARAESEQTLFL